MTIKKYLALVIAAWVFYPAIAKPNQATDSLTIVCQHFDALNTAVRDNKLSKPLAKMQFAKLVQQLRRLTTPVQAQQPQANWVFPLLHYNYRAIGGVHGNGYADYGYSYFDGNKHAAHPAHDIFINDRNQDCLDDHSQQPVDVLSVADGIVVACCNQWDSNSPLRGGKYIWIYHPQLNILSYYAHNNILWVTVGMFVKQGQKIAQVGRSGFNAYKKRSPTHLHFSAYRFVNNLPIPYNCYNQLFNAKTL